MLLGSSFILFSLAPDDSNIDAVGYTIAKKLDIKFLTGDMAFQKLENVEYVR